MAMFERQARVAVVGCISVLLGCSPKAEEPPVGHSGEPMGDCNAVLSSFEGGSQTHVAQCSDISYPMSPPVFGDHYPTWAAYQTYDFPVPLGFLVHDLEHGATVFFYDCPEDCPDEVDQVRTFIGALPADPRCEPFGIDHQVV